MNNSSDRKRSLEDPSMAPPSYKRRALNEDFSSSIHHSEVSPSLQFQPSAVSSAELDVLQNDVPYVVPSDIPQLVPSVVPSTVPNFVNHSDEHFDSNPTNMPSVKSDAFVANPVFDSHNSIPNMMMTYPGNSTSDRTKGMVPQVATSGIFQSSNRFVNDSSSSLSMPDDSDIFPHEVGTGNMITPLSRNIVPEPSEPTVYACEYPGCNYTHETREVIIRHQQTHTNETIYTCEAMNCNYTCSQKSTLERHKRKMGHGSEALTCTILNCGYISTDRTDMYSHFVNRHPSIPVDENTFAAPEEFDQGMYFDSHKELIGMDNLMDHGQKQYRTIQVDNSYLSMSQIRISDSQRSSLSIESKSFQCEIPGCDFSAAQRGNLEAHRRKHTGERPHRCTHPGCSYSASMKSHLDAHMRTHTGHRPHACTWENCNYRASEKHHLKAHMRTHTGEKPYKCPTPGCGYRSARMGDLKTHQRKHTGSRPYKCEYPNCPYAAASQSHLVKHRRTHTGERPFKCNYAGCDYAASVSGLLKKHKRARHGETVDQKLNVKAYKCDEPNCGYTSARFGQLRKHKQQRHGLKQDIVVVPNASPMDSRMYGMNDAHLLNSSMAMHDMDMISPIVSHHVVAPPSIVGMTVGPPPVPVPLVAEMSAANSNPIEVTGVSMSTNFNV